MIGDKRFLLIITVVILVFGFQRGVIASEVADEGNYLSGVPNDGGYIVVPGPNNDGLLIFDLNQNIVASGTKLGRQGAEGTVFHLNFETSNYSDVAFKIFFTDKSTGTPEKVTGEYRFQYSVLGEQATDFYVSRTRLDITSGGSTQTHNNITFSITELFDGTLQDCDWSLVPQEHRASVRKQVMEEIDKIIKKLDDWHEAHPNAQLLPKDFSADNIGIRYNPADMTVEVVAFDTGSGLDDFWFSEQDELRKIQKKLLCEI